MLRCFGMIWNCDNFSKWNTKSYKICTFSRIHIYTKLIAKKKKKHIGAHINKINKKFQNISLENSFLWKHDFWQKDPKMDNSLKCKRKHISSLNVVWTHNSNSFFYFFQVDIWTLYYHTTLKHCLVKAPILSNQHL